MKVLALNGSPRMERGKTAELLSHVLQGMTEAGADVELVYTSPLEVKPCLGCLACWTRTPGHCAQRDDMDELLPKIVSAETLVLATPVYVDGMTSTMKAVLDRCVAGSLPFFEILDDHCRHPKHVKLEASKLLLVSVSGFTEMDNFAPLIAHVKAICKNMRREYSGAVLRPAAWAMDVLRGQGAPVDAVWEAAKEAGRQLVRDGAIAQETLEAVSRELAPRETLVEWVNASFARQLERTAQGGQGASR